MHFSPFGSKKMPQFMYEYAEAKKEKYKEAYVEIV